jgi:hypothetical protein
MQSRLYLTFLYQLGNRVGEKRTGGAQALLCMLVVSVKNFAKTTFRWSPSSSRSEIQQGGEGDKTVDSFPFERDNNLPFFFLNLSPLLFA